RTTPAGAQRIGIVVFCAAVVVIPLSMQLSAIVERDEPARGHSAPVHGTGEPWSAPVAFALPEESDTTTPVVCDRPTDVPFQAAPPATAAPSRRQRGRRSGPPSVGRRRRTRRGRPPRAGRGNSRSPYRSRTARCR